MNQLTYDEFITLLTTISFRKEELEAKKIEALKIKNISIIKRCEKESKMLDSIYKKLQHQYYENCMKKANAITSNAG